MKLLIAFKEYPDLDALNLNDLVIREEMPPDLHFLPFTLNCYDESALELALRLRDSRFADGAETELTAITAGGEHTEQALQTLRALGYSHTVRVKADDDYLRFHPECVAATVSAYAKYSHQDVLLLGREAPLGNGACIPQLVAAEMGLPLIPNVVDILQMEKCGLVVRIADSFRVLEQTVSVPCVLSVGNARVSKLRVPTLRERLNCKGIKSEHFEMLSADDAVYPVPERLTLPNHGRKGFVCANSGSTALEEALLASPMERPGAL